MNIELLFLTRKHTDKLFEQTKTNPQETLKFKMNRQMVTFSFNPPLNLVEEGIWLLTRTSFEAANFVFKITAENNSFSNTIPSYWYSRGGEETMKRLREILGLRELKDIELHIEDVRKRGNQIIKELENVENNDLEDMVFGLKLTYSEI